MTTFLSKKQWRALKRAAIVIGIVLACNLIGRAVDYFFEVESFSVGFMTGVIAMAFARMYLGDR